MRSFQSCTSTPHPLMGIGFSSVGSNEQDHPNRPGDAPKVVQKDLKHQSRLEPDCPGNSFQNVIWLEHLPSQKGSVSDGKKNWE